MFPKLGEVQIQEFVLGLIASVYESLATVVLFPKVYGCMFLRVEFGPVSIHNMQLFPLFAIYIYVFQLHVLQLCLILMAPLW